MEHLNNVYMFRGMCLRKRNMKATIKTYKHYLNVPLL